MPLKPAVFLDRDGTLMVDVDYPRDPHDVQLIPGVPEALRRLHDAGFALVVVSNQSGIGRGIITQAQHDAVQAEFERQLAAAGVGLDGAYHCPLSPVSSDKHTVDHPDRKPGPGMLQRAARELNLSLPDSWIVGDKLSDALAGRNAGCRGGVLVTSGKALGEEERAHPAVACCVAGLGEAADYILRHHGGRASR